MKVESIYPIIKVLSKTARPFSKPTNPSPSDLKNISTCAKVTPTTRDSLQKTFDLIYASKNSKAVSLTWLSLALCGQPPKVSGTSRLTPSTPETLPAPCIRNCYRKNCLWSNLTLGTRVTRYATPGLVTLQLSCKSGKKC